MRAESPDRLWQHSHGGNRGKTRSLRLSGQPADADEIDAALNSIVEARPALPQNPMSAHRVRWEHIQRVYELCSRNVSETARRLAMHRRTSQRILAKRAPR